MNAAFRPTTSADHPDAKAFADRCLTRNVSGLVLLSIVCARGGHHGQATDMLRALEDMGDIACTGPDPKAGKAWRGDLVGQMYGVGRGWDAVVAARGGGR